MGHPDVFRLGLHLPPDSNCREAVSPVEMAAMVPAEDNRPGISRARKAARIAWVVLVVALLVTAAYRPVTRTLRAASVLLTIQNANAQGWLARYGTNPVDVQDAPFTVNGAANPARLYVPRGVANAPAIVVVHGVHHLGMDEPRLVNFARTLASHGFLVMTPEVADLADYRVTPQSIDVIGEAAHALKVRSGAKHVGVLGLSFAGGLALMAADDPRYAPDIAWVAAVGAHDDLQRVLEFYATNQIEAPDGTIKKMKAHEYGCLVVVYEHPGLFFEPQDVETARKALRYQLWEDMAKAKAEAAKLSPDGQRKMDLLLEHRTGILAPEILANIAKHSAEMAAVSPHGHVANVRVPVFLLAGSADNVIPPTETLWLERDLPPGTVRECLISPVVSHVELESKPTLKNRLELVHFMTELLNEADRSSRPVAAHSSSTR